MGLCLYSNACWGSGKHRDLWLTRWNLINSWSGAPQSEVSLVKILKPVDLKITFKWSVPSKATFFFWCVLSIYLAALGHSCSKHDLHCVVWDLLLWHTDCLVVAHGPQSTQGVVALRLSCSAACGILVPWSGIEPTSPALQGRFLTTGPPGTSHGGCFKYWHLFPLVGGWRHVS